MSVQLFKEEEEEEIPRHGLEERGKMVVLSEEGYSQRQIAARIGCSQENVSLILKQSENQARSKIEKSQEGLGKQQEERTV